MRILAIRGCNLASLAGEFEIDLKLDTSRNPSDLEDLKAKLARGELVAIVTTVAPSAATQADASASQPAATAPSAAASPTLDVPSSMNVKHTGLIEDLVQASTARAHIEAAGLDVQTVRDLARAMREAGHDVLVQVAQRQRRAHVGAPSAEDVVGAVDVRQHQALAARLDLPHVAGRHLTDLGDFLPIRHPASPCVVSPA